MFSFSEAILKLKQGRKVVRKNNQFAFENEKYDVEYIYLFEDAVWVKTKGNAPYPMEELRIWFTLDDLLAEDWCEVKL